MDILRRAALHLPRTAVVHGGKSYTYENLLSASEQLGQSLSRQVSQQKQRGGAPPRIGLYAKPGVEYVVGTWAIWQSGCIAVPLATSHPHPELCYVFQDAGISLALSTEDAISKVGKAAAENSARVELIVPPQGTCTPGRRTPAQPDELLQPAPHSSGSMEQGALIIYTSGTTGKPKGVLHSHRSLMAQVTSLVTAWEWAAGDSILHPLPLHHVHGIVNALYCPHYSGAAVEFMDKFSPAAVWQRLTAGGINVFMGVPTMYNLLLQAYDAMPPEQQRAAAAAAGALRLTVSGSSACPVPLMERWRGVTGQPLLERFGMSEIGMALSNPYRGQRQPGTVGTPLPGVSCKIAQDGELLVKGPTLFSEYWGRPQATAEAFDAEGFFKTGDTAACSPADGYYTILGRTSVDILKSGGYKVSALEVEGVLMEHPAVLETAVLGVPDEVYGEAITALVVPKPITAPAAGAAPAAAAGGASGSRPLPDSIQVSDPAAAAAAAPLPAALRQHCAARLAPYQSPRRYVVIDALPRNAMGKVNKKELLKLFFPDKVAPARK